MPEIVVISFNGVSSTDWGHRVGYENYDQPAEALWPNMPEFLQGVEVFFGRLAVRILIIFAAQN